MVLGLGCGATEATVAGVALTTCGPAADAEAPAVAAPAVAAAAAAPAPAVGGRLFFGLVLSGKSMTRSGVCFCRMVTRCSQKSRLFRKPPLAKGVSSPSSDDVTGGRDDDVTDEPEGEEALVGLRGVDGLWNDVRRSHKSLVALALLKFIPPSSLQAAAAVAPNATGSCMWPMVMFDCFRSGIPDSTLSSSSTKAVDEDDASLSADGEAAALRVVATAL